MCASSFVSVGVEPVGPVTGSASKTILSMVPFLRLAGGTPRPLLGAAPPGATVAEAKRSNGPENPPLVAAGSIVTQPFASGTSTTGGIGPHGVPAGGRGEGGGVGPGGVAPEPAT